MTHDDARLRAAFDRYTAAARGNDPDALARARLDLSLLLTALGEALPDVVQDQLHDDLRAFLDAQED